MTSLDDGLSSPEPVRVDLATNLDRKPLSADAVVAIAYARGVGPTAATWTATDSPQFFLSADDYAWIADQRKPDNTRTALGSAIPDDPSAVNRTISRDDEAFRNLSPDPPADIRSMRS